MIEKNCILTPDGYIDTCPAYRTQMRSLNEMFRGMWSKQEQTTPSQQDIFLALSKFTIQLQTTKKKLYMSKQATADNIFIIEYLTYLSKKYQQEI